MIPQRITDSISAEIKSNREPGSLFQKPGDTDSYLLQPKPADTFAPRTQFSPGSHQSFLILQSRTFQDDGGKGLKYSKETNDTYRSYSQGLLEKRITPISGSSS